MNTARRLSDLNPSDRPARAPAVAPPARPTAPPAQPAPPPRPDRAADRTPAAQSDLPGESSPAQQPPPPEPGGVREKAGKVMHSVPLDVLERLKQTAARSGLSYTDIVINCILDHHEKLASPRAGDRQPPGGALARRRDRRQPSRSPAVQLTLYLTRAELAELEQLAAECGMLRSHLVTAALRRGLHEPHE